MNTRLWRNAFKIAWRDMRAAPGKFLFVILAVAAGVGALSGVRGFSGAFRDMLLRDARILMAADLSVRTYHVPDPDEQEALDELTARGAERTWITETVSMISSPNSPRPLLTAIKAVEPDKYPFYGQIETRPPGSLQQHLSGGAALASDDLLLRLGVEVGDSVRVGEEEFRIAAVLTVEPDRMTGSFNVGPRLMLSREGLDRAGLITRGSRAAQRYLFKLPAQGLTLQQARDRLETRFRRYWIADYRETHPTIRRGLDRATNFLSLVSLVAMIVGALGVGMAMYSHIQQRLDTIAIMKCIGARSSQIIRIYLLQALGLGMAGSLLGVFLGYLVQAAGPGFVAQYFPTAPDLEWQPLVGLQAVSIGLLTTLLFSLPPLLGIRRIRPALIFRREMEKMNRTVAERFAAWRETFLSGAAILVGLGAAAAWLGGSAELGLFFAGGLLASVAVLTASAWALLRGLRALPGALPFRLPTALRHGIANLHRPGVHAEAILVALGVGVTFTLAVYLVQSSVVTQLVRSAPPDMPNVFLLNVTDGEKDGLNRLISQHPGVTEPPSFVASVAARLLTIDGQPLDEAALGENAARFRQTRNLTWTVRQPDEVELLQGSWWEAEARGNAVAVREDVAEILRLRPGARLEWMVGAGRVEATVTSVFRVETIRPSSSQDFILNPSALEGQPAVYYGGVRVAPEQAAALQKAAFDEFSSVMVVNASDVLAIVQEVVDQIAVVIEFVSAFAILGGMVVLASSVMATRFRRLRETAVLKTLGATRRKVAHIFSVEFLILGAAAGLIGAALASGFAAFLLEQVLESAYGFELLPALAAVAATALLAVAAGWLASFRILDRKPLEVLRSE